MRASTSAWTRKLKDNALVPLGTAKLEEFNDTKMEEFEENAFVVRAVMRRTKQRGGAMTQRDRKVNPGPSTRLPPSKIIIEEIIIFDLVLDSVQRRDFSIKPLNKLSTSLHEINYPRAGVRFRLSRTIVEMLSVASSPQSILNRLGPDTVLDAVLHYVGILPLVPGGFPADKLAELRRMWRYKLEEAGWVIQRRAYDTQKEGVETSKGTPSTPSTSKTSTPIDTGINAPIAEDDSRRGGVIIFDEPIEDIPDREDMVSLKPYKDLYGERLPIKTACAEKMLPLKDKYPWACDLIDHLYADLRASPERVGPYILLGEPGIGKSRLAQDIVDQLGFPYTLISAGGYSDSAFGGTSRRWGTAHPSTPTSLISKKGLANPIIVIDELDKAGGSTQHGKFHDVLLGMTEPDTAEQWYDPGLGAKVNLKHIGWIATANIREDIPEALRDRFKILRMPAPRPGDAEAIIKAVWRNVEWHDPLWAALANKDRNAESLFARSRAPIEPDEIQAIVHLWRGTTKVPSLRRLERIVERWVQRKHALPGTASGRRFPSSQSVAS